MFKKRDMIIIVCTISVVVMGLVFWKTFSCKKQDKLSSIVRAYQWPNGMFCDTLATDEEIENAAKEILEKYAGCKVAVSCLFSYPSGKFGDALYRLSREKYMYK